MSAGSQQWIVEELAPYLTLTIDRHKVVRSVNKTFHIIADQIARHEQIFNGLNLLHNYNMKTITLSKMQYLRQMGCQWNKWTTAYAAENGHLDCLKWAHENGCPWDEDTNEYAASRGHLNCLKYVRENGCPWDERTTYWAVISGHLDCLKYAHENDCPWDENTTTFAAKYGHLDCLKYALENGCLMSDNILDTAHHKCRQYLQSRQSRQSRCQN
jgi:hypothetical protein